MKIDLHINGEVFKDVEIAELLKPENNKNKVRIDYQQLPYDVQRRLGAFCAVMEAVTPDISICPNTEQAAEVNDEADDF